MQGQPGAYRFRATSSPKWEVLKWPELCKSPVISTGNLGEVRCAHKQHRIRLIRKTGEDGGKDQQSRMDSPATSGCSSMIVLTSLCLTILSTVGRGTPNIFASNAAFRIPLSYAVMMSFFSNRFRHLPIASGLPGGCIELAL